ncbi:hypothetical protein PF005_g3225 [Phytophthora fragariae]|uniref:RxLR effector protein n=1 Tax=Phytophthora fragariae TaxID=53985 RepID=A0A6A3FS12_9STRA|nr:hypothetical protein PF009_g2633 [Phytophthora fragariae]KAE9133577.1 hypothetical protein PF010_g2772 [Phytophthora fragariae]KAE9133962.1 hypothetical protein PF007_g3119 [Phytophthora fragariae]KAE9231135.1 hypothetical protein PF005_g3225 [Phytophthora fragariae]KAE9241886.1 hypothetical protein PF004_g6859 [Phytophthora fragariae]
MSSSAELSAARCLALVSFGLAVSVRITAPGSIACIALQAMLKLEVADIDDSPAALGLTELTSFRCYDD